MSVPPGQEAIYTRVKNTFVACAKISFLFMRQSAAPGAEIPAQFGRCGRTGIAQSVPRGATFCAKNWIARFG
jgi:hypothetical protein